MTDVLRRWRILAMPRAVEFTPLTKSVCSLSSFSNYFDRLIERGQIFWTPHTEAAAVMALFDEITRG